MKEQVAAIETPDPRHVRFKLKKPWPDFLTFYATASGAGWIVPKKYVEKVGDDGFKKHPIGAGPYKFVSFTPGVELVLEAFEGYWRKSPERQAAGDEGDPDEATRLAALEARRGRHRLFDPRRTRRGTAAHARARRLKSVVLQAPIWLYFPEQWDPKSPWHDLRVRQAANLAIDREGMNKALFLGYCKITNSIIPDTFEYYWQPPPAVYDPAKAKKLLAEAGFPNGFDAGAFYCDSSYANIGEVAVEQSPARSASARKLQPIERAGFRRRLTPTRNTPTGSSRGERRLRQRRDPARLLRRQGRRLRLWQLSRHRRALPAAGRRARPEEARRRSSKRCSSSSTRRRSIAPIWQLAFLNGVGPRVGESAFGRIPGFPYTAPFEDITIKGS